MGSQHKFQPTARESTEVTEDPKENHHAQALESKAEQTPVIDGQYLEVEAKAMPAIDAAKLSEIAKAFQAKTANTFSRTPDGGIVGTFRIEPEIALVFQSWSESAGEPLHEFAQVQINEALQQYVNGG